VNVSLADLDNDIDGAALLDKIRDVLTRYVALPSDDAAIGIVLWIVATHAVAKFEHATRLAIHSAVKRSGKSRLLEVIAALVYEPLSTTNISPAALFRVVDKAGDRPPTLILDEADRLFGSQRKDDDNRDLIGLLNAGFRKGAQVWRCVGPQQQPMPFSAYAMVAVAGIGRKPDTVEDRAVNVTMRRRLPGERVDKFRLGRDLVVMHELRGQITGWMAEHLDELSGPVEDMPDLEDRAEDAWEPLLAVADAAGGEWPKLARDAAAKLAAEAVDADDESLEIRLLQDVKDVFESMPHVGFLNSRVLLTELRGIDDAPWSEVEFTTRKLAMRLGKFDIKPRRNAAGTERGYHLEDLADAFRRYLRPKASEPVRSASDQRKRSDGLTGVSDTSRATRQKEPPTRQSKTAGQKPSRRVLTGSDVPTGETVPCIDCQRPIPAYQVDKRGGRCVRCHYRAGAA
jgi:hypothetical protein